MFLAILFNFQLNMLELFGCKKTTFFSITVISEKDKKTQDLGSLVFIAW